ncbi:MAG TPA: hypothetical protein VKT77_06620 [Chthonomonadaceae bacterium]|nr:hypothetical protein [Chthonomonadaceae bacterium]
MPDPIWNVRLVPTDDPDYIAFMRRMADRRPSRGGPRASGEVLGGLVERAVQHWLARRVELLPERILVWEQRQRNGRNATLFREIDAIWQIDAESLCLYEVKLTYAENMEQGVGLRQLDASTETLFASGRYRYILQRLVYIAPERVTVLDGLPELEPDDECAELGVVWAPPDEIEAAARELEIDLPENWLEPESREGVVEDPEREAWREFADTAARDPDADEPTGPLTEALRRSLGNTQ